MRNVQKINEERLRLGTNEYIREGKNEAGERKERRKRKENCIMKKGSYCVSSPKAVK